MNDLKEAIQNLLVDAIPDDTAKTDDMDEYTVRKKFLRILQAEYNIHFVEPENEQLDVI